jgi:microcystin-dependent protein
MAEPFLSEIRLFSMSFPPKGWAFCNGQLLPINQNQPLFALLGTRFGGNGQTNFALPNLQGRVPIHVGNGHTLGEAGGVEAQTVTTNQMPTHTHQGYATTATATAVDPTGNLLAPLTNGYGAPSSLTTLTPATVANVGGSQPHNNMQPYLALNFCIALQGIFPSPT